ncbi:MAG TPA: zf-HC2 domain-containing protein, partial [Candidatus Eisenbacteria bacterium]|nr:zf-HC2 domain-containing protein [Candidatus Eisenbacteria bacterium]
MSDPRDVDPRLHAYLDGELSADEAAQFDGDLRPGSIPRNQLETLMHLGAWFRATRPRAPATLARSVELALRLEQAASQTPSQKAGRFRWLWAPTMAMA